MNLDRSLRTADIQQQQQRRPQTVGATTTMAKPSFALTTTDICAKPRACTDKPAWVQCDLRPKREYTKNRPNFQYDVTDITGKRKPEFATKRCTNPLAPAYHLPVIECVAEKPMPFLRDQIYNRDIEKSSPMNPHSWVASRDHMNYDDVAGAAPRAAYTARNCNRQSRSAGDPLLAPWRPSYHDVSDITDVAFQTKRHTNPLMPTYTCRCCVVCLWKLFFRSCDLTLLSLIARWRTRTRAHFI
jgi:hypothetical protein